MHNMANLLPLALPMGVEAETWFRNLLDVFKNSEIGLSVFERFPGRLERRLVCCNVSYAAMGGRTVEELYALPDIRAVQYSGHNTNDAIDFPRKLENLRPYEGAFYWLRPDGRPNLVHYMAIPIILDERIFVIGFDRMLSGTE